MNCKSVRTQLSAYLDRELPGSEMLEMRAHLSDCRSCQEEFEALRSLKLLIANSPSPEPPADLADRLCASVLAEYRPDSRKFTSRPSFRVSLMTFAGVAACSTALTYALLNGVHSVAVKPEQQSVALTNPDLAFDVQRDQVYAAGFDATSGFPVMSTPRDDHPSIPSPNP